jgi:hypothetical protein
MRQGGRGRVTSRIEQLYISYDDILNRISERPTWWDNGIPRYGKFHPANLGIYCNVGLLVHTECQMCGLRFDCGTGVRYSPQDFWDRMDINPYEIGLGDPPNHNCYGDSMSAWTIQIIECWERRDFDWVRNHGREIPWADADQGKSESLIPFKGLISRLGILGMIEQWTDTSSNAERATLLRRAGYERAEYLVRIIEAQKLMHDAGVAAGHILSGETSIS